MSRFNVPKKDYELTEEDLARIGVANAGSTHDPNCGDVQHHDSERASVEDGRKEKEELRRMNAKA